VCIWLERLGLQDYTETFRSNDIDGKILLTLSKEELTNELGIKSLGVKKKITLARNALAESIL